MFTILLHSSKTMRQPMQSSTHVQKPALEDEARELTEILKTLSREELQKVMAISPKMAETTYELIHSWHDSAPTLAAIDIFLGDIYSGLQATTLSDDDRRYANEHLVILSGLYGALRALDTIQPYRLEMGYKLPGMNLYEFWSDTIAKLLPAQRPIVNLSAVEYTKAVLPYMKATRVISPKFLTVSPKTGEPTFVTVHAKIARGAFAKWMIQHRIESTAQLLEFNEIGYSYEPTLSTETEPVFVAQQFKGIGLSVRLNKLI
ncbi:hypothetical protein BGO17_02010 [Candidatus Saccharibacteria bacterium 49-20]|nr:MAG: hypothetical protein BGO17_02010 [Candidatus Saccharibacteria bacterium 49-20]